MTTILGYVEPGYLVIEAPEIISPKEIAKAKGKTEILLSDSAKKSIERERAQKLEEALSDSLKGGQIVLAHTPTGGKPDKTGKYIVGMAQVIGEDLMLPALVDGEKKDVHCIIMHESNVLFTYDEK